MELKREKGTLGYYKSALNSLRGNILKLLGIYIVAIMLVAAIEVVLEPMFGEYVEFVRRIAKMLLSYGLAAYLLKLIRTKEEAAFNEILSFKDNIATSIGAGVRTAIYKLPVEIILMVTLSILYLFIDSFMIETYGMDIIMVFVNVFFAVTFFMLADKKAQTGKEAVNGSIKFGKDNYNVIMKILLLNLVISLIVALVTIAITFGILALNPSIFALIAILVIGSVINYVIAITQMAAIAHLYVEITEKNQDQESIKW